MQEDLAVMTAREASLAKECREQEETLEEALAEIRSREETITETRKERDELAEQCAVCQAALTGKSEELCAKEKALGLAESEKERLIEELSVKDALLIQSQDEIAEANQVAEEAVRVAEQQTIDVQEAKVLYRVLWNVGMKCVVQAKAQEAVDRLRAVETKCTEQEVQLAAGSAAQLVCCAFDLVC